MSDGQDDTDHRDDEKSRGQGDGTRGHGDDGATASDGGSEAGDPGHERTHREEFHDDPVEHARARAGMTVGELVNQYGAAGIGAAELNEAADVFADMLADDDCTVFLSLAGAMVPAGMRRIVADLIREGHVDALITTGANLTHDSIEAIGGSHHHGRDRDPEKSLREHDEQLRDEEVDRIYNVYLPQEHFATFETHLRESVFPELEAEGTVSIARFTEELGRANAAANEAADSNAGPGIAAAAVESGVPIYCPAVQDSILGLQAWIYSQTSDFSLDALADMTDLTDIAYEAETAGCLLVGGGVPKNFTLQTMLVTPGAYDYAVQVTMDPEESGGLSGATLEEARSWGKLNKDASNASVYGDATVMLPILVANAYERLADD